MQADKSHQLPGDFRIKFPARSPDGLQAGGVTDPEDGARKIAADNELNHPEQPPQAGLGTTTRRQTITLKGDMPRFIPKNQFTHRRQGPVR